MISLYILFLIKITNEYNNIMRGNLIMKKLINDREQFVSDMLAGLKYNDPKIDIIEENVVVRKNKTI